MIPPPFEYERASDIAHAIKLLAASKGEANILAGGQSLIPLMRFRLAESALLIDISRLRDLAYIRENGELRIGALTKEAELEHSAMLAQRYPILVDASSVIADPLVRNLSTVGGNLAHADPANDHPAVMLALRASVVVRGSAGERTIAIDDLFVDTFTTSLKAEEIITEIRIPKAAARSGAAYVKLERKVGDFAIAGVAASLTLDEKGRVATVGIGLTNVSAKPIRAKRAEAALKGQAFDDKWIAKAAAEAAAESEPVTDLRGPAEYKRDIVRVLTTRALRKAHDRAMGDAR